jgi:hypothetical protein
MSSPISISAKSDLVVNSFMEYSSPPTRLVVKKDFVIDYPPNAPRFNKIIGFNIESKLWTERPKEEY